MPQSIEERMNAVERAVALQDYKIEQISAKLDSLETKVDELLAILQRINGAKWVLYTVFAFIGAWIGKITGFFTMIVNGPR